MFGHEVLEPLAFVAASAGGVGRGEEGRVGAPVGHREVAEVVLTYSDHLRECGQRGVHILRLLVGWSGVGDVDDEHGSFSTVRHTAR